MKRAYLFLVAILAIVLVACGGSGGGGSSTGTNKGPTGPTTAPRIEAVVKISQTNIKPEVVAAGKYSDADLLDPQKVDPNDLVDPTIYGVQDQENIQTGEEVIFELVNYTTTATGVVRNILPADNWITSDRSGLYGTIANDSGRFVAGQQETIKPLAVSTVYQNRIYNSTFDIKPRQVRAIGRLLQEDTLKGVQGVTIEFYAPQNPADDTSALVFVGRVQTSYDGSFRASLPADSSGRMVMQVVNSTIPEGYYRSFVYKNARYATGSETCRASVTDASGNPLTVGTRLLVDPSLDSNPVTNGTILLTAKSDTHYTADPSNQFVPVASDPSFQYNDGCVVQP